MRVSTLGFALAACLWLAAFEALRSPPTVQLPTFSFASVGTTVMVPDGGAAFLGRHQSRVGRPQRVRRAGDPFPGFQNRGIGQDRSASSFWVTATIHDFDAMDQALLNTPSPDGLAEDLSRACPAVCRKLLRLIAGRTFQRNPVNLAGNWRVEPDPPASRERRGGRAGRSGDPPGHPGRRGRQLLRPRTTGRGRRQAERGQDLLPDGCPACHGRPEAAGSGPLGRRSAAETRLPWRSSARPCHSVTPTCLSP